MDLLLAGDPLDHLGCIVATATGTIAKVDKVNVEVLRELCAKAVCSTAGLD